MMDIRRNRLERNGRKRYEEGEVKKQSQEGDVHGHVCEQSSGFESQKSGAKEKNEKKERHK